MILNSYSTIHVPSQILVILLHPAGAIANCPVFAVGGEQVTIEETRFGLVQRENLPQKVN